MIFLLHFSSAFWLSSHYVTNVTDFYKYTHIRRIGFFFSRLFLIRQSLSHSRLYFLGAHKFIFFAFKFLMGAQHTHSSVHLVRRTTNTHSTCLCMATSQMRICCHASCGSHANDEYVQFSKSLVQPRHSVHENLFCSRHLLIYGTRLWETINYRLGSRRPMWNFTANTWFSSIVCMRASWLFRNLDVDTDSEWRWLVFETWIDLWLVLFLCCEKNSLHFFCTLIDSIFGCILEPLSHSLSDWSEPVMMINHFLFNVIKTYETMRERERLLHTNTDSWVVTILWVLRATHDPRPNDIRFAHKNK